jgi:hypothetical protein
MKKLFLLSVLMLLPMLASADKVEIDGIYYYLNEKDGQATMAKNPKKYSGSVIIPESVVYEGENYSVTSIGSFALSGCSDLTSVTIPNSVTSIGSGAFEDCSGLTSIIIPNSVTFIGEAAFQDCSGLSSVTIGNSVKYINNHAFSGCSGLISVHITDIAAWCNIFFDILVSNPLSIAHHLYLNGEEVKDLVLPNSVTSISNYAFWHCSCLTSVTIGNSVTSIGYKAFEGCNGLSSVTIGNSVTSIGNYAFKGCTGLTSLTIPNSVTSIGYDAFEECTGLTSVTIPNSVISIGSDAFKGCSGLTSVTIPNSVTSIGSGAFSGINFKSVISKIEYLFEIGNSTFNQVTYDNAILYIPKGTLKKYQAVKGWKNFLTIEEKVFSDDDENIPGATQCSRPTIHYKNGTLSFSSQTEGASFQYTISDSDIKSDEGNVVKLNVTYNISVYATKTGYNNSDIATATLCWIDVDPKTEGITDNVAQVRAKAVLIQSNGSTLSISGAEDGTSINVYSINGAQVGSAISQNGEATINTILQPSSVAIVKIGDKSVKVVIK